MIAGIFFLKVKFYMTWNKKHHHKLEYISLGEGGKYFNSELTYKNTCIILFQKDNLGGVN